ncbi:MAG: insulinase family protein [Candidatus Aminicenantes bacterium]|nr:insulinase family protein [Candidatus Aminicenantes bacterium]
MKVKKFVLVLVLISALSLTLEAKYKFEKFYLSNGLTVILSPSNNSAAVCVLLYHKIGTRHDPPGLHGATYLYRNLMHLGTRTFDPYERFLFVKRHGGISNRQVKHDNSIFYQVMPEAELNNALWHESERISSLKLTDRAIDTHKNSEYRRIYSTINGNVNAAANRWIKSVVFADTVYQTPEYGSLEAIGSFDNREIKKLYQNFKNPADIVLIIAGNFDKTMVRKSVDRYFAPLPAGKRDPREKLNIPAPRKEYVYKNWLRKDIPYHFVTYGIRAPSKRSQDHLYFNFVKYYLVDERISKLEKILSRKNNLDVTINSEYTNHFDCNALIIKISTANRETLETVKYVLAKEFDALLSKALSQSELKATKSLMEIDFRKNMALLEKRSIIAAENFHMFADLDFEAEYIKRIRGITTYNILDISKKYLNEKNRVILNVVKQ